MVVRRRKSEPKVWGSPKNAIAAFDKKSELAWLHTTRAAYLKIHQAIVLQIQFVIVQIDVWHFEILTKDLSAKQMDLVYMWSKKRQCLHFLYHHEFFITFFACKGRKHHEVKEDNATTSLLSGYHNKPPRNKQT
jgi:hypothetical protein